MFSIDPGILRHIPRSEYRKRRDYWRMWSKAQNPNAAQDTGVAGVTQTSWSDLEEGAKIVEG